MDYFSEKIFEKESEIDLGHFKRGQVPSAPLSYPGNVRELENLIERAVVLCRGEIITTQDFPFHLREEKSERHGKVQRSEKSLPESLEEIEKDLIVKALDQHRGIQTKAAESLGISERVLRYKLKKYGFVLTKRKNKGLLK